MRPIRSLIVFAAGATAATPRGRAAVKRAFGASGRRAPGIRPGTRSGPGDGSQRSGRATSAAPSE